MVVCPHCGAENHPGSNFCRKCGKPLDSAAGADASDGAKRGDAGDFGDSSTHDAAGVGSFNFSPAGSGTARGGTSSFSAPSFPTFNFTPSTDSASSKPAANGAEDREVSPDGDGAAAAAQVEEESQTPTFAIPTFAPPAASASSTPDAPSTSAQEDVATVPAGFPSLSFSVPDQGTGTRPSQSQSPEQSEPAESSEPTELPDPTEASTSTSWSTSESGSSVTTSSAPTATSGSPAFVPPTFTPPAVPQGFATASAEDSGSVSPAAPEASAMSSDATAPEAASSSATGATSTSTESANPAAASPAPTNPAGAFPMAEDQYGSTCAWHPHRQKVTTCAKCGRSLCDECEDALTVSGGEYGGQPLCYSCLNELASSEVAEFQKNRSTITRRNVVALVFMVAGFVIGLVHGRNEGRGAALLVFNCILDALVFGGLPNYPHCLAEDVKKCNTGSVGTTIVRFIATLIGDLFKAMFRTLGQFARYRRYTNGARDLLAQNQAALQQVNAFMAYTRLHDDNGGLDLDALMSEHQELYSNPYAQQLRTNGEHAANQSVRSGCSRIVENAATIADFAV